MLNVFSTRVRISSGGAFVTIFISFYRATLCVSAVLLWPGVRPTVCLSVTFVHSIQTAEDIVKLLCQPGSPIILVFNPERRYTIPREPLQRGRKIEGVGKFCDFRLKSPYISETVRDRPMVALER